MYSAKRIAAFWDKVDTSGECWMWTAYRDKQGYGTFWNGKRTVKATAFAWTLAGREIPAGHGMLHTCDNPPCVRLEHLFTGTSADNNKDAHTKGRRSHQRGTFPHKLTEQQVRDARQMAANGMRHTAIAQIFGVSSPAIYDAVTGRRWKWVT